MNAILCILIAIIHIVVTLVWGCDGASTGMLFVATAFVCMSIDSLKNEVKKLKK